MATSSATAAPRQITGSVRERIEEGGERVWRLEDFADLPFSAVAQALSRLARQGVLQRLGKGLYYRSRETPFGTSRPNPAAIRQLAGRRRSLFPSGVAAANLLGFTTQSASRPELATSGLSLPRLLVGRDTKIHTRRPEAWRTLSETDAALLDFLRRHGETSELSPAETVRRLLALCSEKGRYERLVKVADTEPPRVRAMLGAVGQQLGKSPPILHRLRSTLNSLSRFEFGALSDLKYAAEWQAKERRIREAQ